MNKKLFVGGLPWEVNDEKLKELFSSFGEIVSAVVITDKASGRSKGFGFVEFETEDAAQTAIKEMNGKEVEGRTITVNEARPLKQ